MVKQAAVITEQEHARWESKVIGNHKSSTASGSYFFYVGKTFCLRGGQEQCNLKPSQFFCSSSPDCYTYVENGSKNKLGINMKENNKAVPVYANPLACPRCFLFDFLCRILSSMCSFVYSSLLCPVLLKSQRRLTNKAKETC